MPPIILTVLQGLFLLLLYVFVARAVRWVVRDVALSTSGRPAPRPAATPVRSAPERRRRAKNVPNELVVHIAAGRPQVLSLRGASEITFGRAPDCTVPLDDPYVSDHHVRVYREGGDWLVVDTGSTNGTFLNQVKVTAPTPLAGGDQLAVGKTVVEVRR